MEPARAPGAGGALERHRDALELADRGARPTARRDHRVRAAAVAHARVDERPLERELAAHARGDPVRELADRVRRAELDRRALEASGALDEHIARTVHEDVGHRGVVEIALEGAEAEQLRAQLVELIVGERSTRRDADALAQDRPARGLGVQRKKAGRVHADRDLGPHACEKARVDQWSDRSSSSIARSVGARAAKSSLARYGSGGIAASRGKPTRPAIRAASSGSAAVTTSPTAHGARSRSGTAQKSAWSWAVCVPLTTQSRSSVARSPCSSASAPAPRSATSARPPAAVSSSAHTRAASKLAWNDGEPGRNGTADQRETSSRSRPGCTSASTIVAADRPARSASEGAQRSRSTRSGASPPAAERWATSAATLLAPPPAASDQNAMRFPPRSAAGRGGPSGASGSVWPVASRTSASPGAASGAAAGQARTRLMRTATCRAPRGPDRSRRASPGAAPARRRPRWRARRRRRARGPSRRRGRHRPPRTSRRDIARARSPRAPRWRRRSRPRRAARAAAPPLDGGDGGQGG